MAQVTRQSQKRSRTPAGRPRLQFLGNSVGAEHEPEKAGRLDGRQPSHQRDPAGSDRGATHPAEPGEHIDSAITSLTTRPRLAPSAKRPRSHAVGRPRGTSIRFATFASDQQHQDYGSQQDPQRRPQRLDEPLF